MTKPLMLWMLGDAKPFMASLEKAGLDDRFDVAVVPSSKKPDADQLARAEILLTFNVPPGMVGEMPKLKWVQSMSVGVDHWLERPDLTPAHVLTAARGQEARDLNVAEVLMKPVRLEQVLGVAGRLTAK